MENPQNHEEPAAPSAGTRFGILGVGLTLLVLVSLSQGPVGLILLPLGLAAGWIKTCSMLFGGGKFAEIMSMVLAVLLGGGGLLVFLVARRDTIWVLGCGMIFLWFVLAGYGCSSIGKFIDG